MEFYKKIYNSPRLQKKNEGLRLCCDDGIICSHVYLMVIREGKANMYLLLAFEYQRRWMKERELWRLKMFPPETDKVDIVKRYVLSFKAKAKEVKEEKKAFKMKQFENIPSRTVNKKEKVTEKKDKNEEKQCKKLK